MISLLRFEEARSYFLAKAVLNLVDVNEDVQHTWRPVEECEYAAGHKDVRRQLTFVRPLEFVVEYEGHTHMVRHRFSREVHATMSEPKSYQHLEVTSPSVDSAKGLFEYAVRLRDRVHNTNIYIYTLSRTSWRKTNTCIPKRPWDLVYMAEDVKRSLKDTLDRCILEDDEFYGRTLQKRKCVILLEGPPGGGKTTLCQAIATHLNRNIATLRVSPSMNDQELASCVDDLPSQCCLVLEDIDSLVSDGKARSVTGSISFSCILQQLDGVEISDGSVIILTTNHPERVEGALTRAGRVDLRMKIPAACREGSMEMIQSLCPQWDRATTKAITSYVLTHKCSLSVLQCFLVKYRKCNAWDLTTKLEELKEISQWQGKEEAPSTHM
jgi:hypothetical protein